jgi:hypothetical protein
MSVALNLQFQLACPVYNEVMISLCCITEGVFEGIMAYVIQLQFFLLSMHFRKESSISIHMFES